MTHICCLQRCKQPCKAHRWWRSPVPSWAPGATGSGTRQDASGRGGTWWGGTSRALAGVLQVAAAICRRASCWPRPSQAPAGCHPATARLAGCRRPGRWLRLLRGSPRLRLLRCQGPGMTPCVVLLFRPPRLVLGRGQAMLGGGVWQQLQPKGGVGVLPGVLALVPVPLGRGRCRSPATWEPGLSGLCQQELFQVDSCPQHEPPSPSPPAQAPLTLLPLVPAVVHAVSAEDGALQNGAHPLSSSEVDELLHKADEATLSEAAGREAPAKVGKEAGSAPASQKPTPRREITGLQAKPRESTVVLPPGEGMEPSREQPVTMIFMGYQNVEDEDETKKVLGLEGTIKAELVVIEDAESKPEPARKDHAPPNGTALEPVAAQPLGEEGPGGQKPGANATDTKEAEQETDVKKQRCKCCTVM